MKTLLATMILALAVSQAQDTKATPKQPTEAETLAAKVKTLEQEARVSKLKEIVMQEQLVTAELTKLRDAKQSAFVDACKGAGIEPDPQVCGVDWQERRVYRLDPPAKK